MVENALVDHEPFRVTKNPTTTTTSAVVVSNASSGKSVADEIECAAAEEGEQNSAGKRRRDTQRNDGVQALKQMCSSKTRVRGENKSTARHQQKLALVSKGDDGGIKTVGSCLEADREETGAEPERKGGKIKNRKKRGTPNHEPRAQQED